MKKRVCNFRRLLCPFGYAVKDFGERAAHKHRRYAGIFIRLGLFIISLA